MQLHRSDLVVLVATRRVAAGFLDVLRDWSAIGLVADFLLVDVDGSAGGQGSPCVEVSGGRVTGARLQTTLATRPAVQSAHVVCLSQVDEEFNSVGRPRAGQVVREVRNALPAVDVTEVHVVSVTEPHEWPRVDPNEVAWSGCHNVVLVPENSRGGSRTGLETVLASPITSVRLTQQAAALCSTAGLWTAERRTGFYGEPAAGGEQMVALRTFSRHLDSDAVTSRLLARVVDVERQYPVPILDGRPIQRSEDQPRAAEAMAAQVLGKHTGILGRSRHIPEDVERSDIGLLELIRLYLRFVSMALRRAPGDFVRHAVYGRVAHAAQAALLGDGSAYVVTVNGIRGLKPDGTRATAHEVDAELDALIAQMSESAGAPKPEQHDYTEFWKDVVAGALTLLDGRARRGLVPEQVAATDAVVTDPLRVVHPPHDVFDLEPELRTVAKIDPVAPHDVEAARAARAVISEAVLEHRDRAAALSAAERRLDDWTEERRRSYAGHLGHRVADEAEQVRKETRDLFAALETSGRPEIPEGLAALQAALTRTLRVHAFVFGLLVVGSVAVTALRWLPWTYGAALVVGLLLAWLVSGAWIFHSRQQALFRVRNRMRDRADLDARLRTNLTEALEDLRRLRRLYRQYLDWSVALGAFVRAPWGTSEAVDGAQAQLGEGYPLNHRFGVAVPDATAIDEVVNQLRPKLFRVGWVGAAWDRFLRDLPAIGADRHLLAENPDLLYSDRAVAHTSLLTQWSRGLADRDWTAGPTSVREELGALLEEGDAHQGRLLSQIRSLSSDGSPSVESYQEFAGGLLAVRTGPVTDGSRFSRAVFAPAPISSAPWDVAQAVSNRMPAAFIDALVATELSGAFDPRDLVFCAESPEVRTPAPPPSTTAPPQV